MTDSTTTYDKTDGSLTLHSWPPAVERFLSSGGSGQEALARVIARGELGQLIKELTELHQDVSKSGFVPDSRRKEHDRYEALAKSVGNDRDLARYYRDKAQKIREQLGEERKSV